MTLLKNSILLLAFTVAHQAAAEGDAARGEKLYNRCSSCHAIIKDGEVLIKGGITGPNLYGVVGRAAGTENDYLNGSERLPIGMFTDDMVRAGENGLVWTQEKNARVSPRRIETNVPKPLVSRDQAPLLRLHSLP